jgi:hypothetical protein
MTLAHSLRISYISMFRVCLWTTAPPKGISPSLKMHQKLLNHAIPAQDQILNFCGISPEWHVMDSVTRFLRTVLAYLEDILSLVMFEGASGLVEAEFLGELLYQKGSRI